MRKGVQRTGGLGGQCKNFEFSYGWEEKPLEGIEQKNDMI